MSKVGPSYNTATASAATPVSGVWYSADRRLSAAIALAVGEQLPRVIPRVSKCLKTRISATFFDTSQNNPGKEKMFTKIAAVAIIAGSLTACASITQDKTQPVKVETLDETGHKITGAKCELQNDRGAFNVETPNTVFVRKSAGELTVSCKAPDEPQADGKLISRTGGAVFGNILFGGVIGAVVDTASGVAYNYPEWIQLTFGKSLTFDRNDFKDAQPTPAKAVPDEKKVAAAPTQPQAQAATPAAPEKVEHITLDAQGVAQK